MSGTSQIDIPTPTADLPRTAAIQIIKDLDACDGLKVRYDLLEKKNSELLKAVQLQDKTVEDLRQNEARLMEVISTISVLQRSQSDNYQALEKKYKREVRAGRFKLVLLGGAVAFGIYQTLK